MKPQEPLSCNTHRIPALRGVLAQNLSWVCDFNCITGSVYAERILLTCSVDIIVCIMYTIIDATQCYKYPWR